MTPSFSKYFNMGIYVGEKLLEPKKNGTSIERMYYDQREELKDFFEKFKIEGEKTPVIILQRDYPKRYNRKKTSWKPAPPASFPMVTNIYDESMGSIQVRYSEAPPARGENNRLNWPRNKAASLFFDTLAISPKQLDLAWFMLRATPYLERGLFRIVDTRSEFSSKFAVAVTQKDVANLLFDEATTLEQLSKVAYEFFKDGEIDYNSITGKEELAIKLWSKAAIEHPVTKKTEMGTLLDLCKKHKLDKQKKKETQSLGKVSVTDDEGNPTEVDILSCPDGFDRGVYIEKAKKLNVATPSKLKNEVLYTVVEYYKEHQPVNNE